jgi:hypothetical protein
MLGIDEYEAIGNATRIDAFLDIGGDVDESPAGRHVEPQLLAVVFHFAISLVGICFTQTSIGSRYQRNRNTFHFGVPGWLDCLRA